MSEKTFKNCIYLVLILLILIFFTKDIDFFYQDIHDIKNPNSLEVLVNKLNRLDPLYIPPDLEPISLEYANEDKYLRKEAKEQFEKLSHDAKEKGYQIIAVSAYRDYHYQDQLFESYVKEKGEEYALKCSARPGHSEHQTGLSLDVMGSNNDYDEFEKSNEFDWMFHNAHKYGFILRYPKGKEYITGFKYEPWHYRYVGRDLASLLYTQNISLEEYYHQYKN